MNDLENSFLPYHFPIKHIIFLKLLASLIHSAINEINFLWQNKINYLFMSNEVVHSALRCLKNIFCFFAQDMISSVER